MRLDCLGHEHPLEHLRRLDELHHVGCLYHPFRSRDRVAPRCWCGSGSDLLFGLNYYPPPLHSPRAPHNEVVGDGFAGRILDRTRGYHLLTQQLDASPVERFERLGEKCAFPQSDFLSALDVPSNGDRRSFFDSFGVYRELEGGNWLAHKWFCFFYHSFPPRLLGKGHCLSSRLRVPFSH